MSRQVTLVVGPPCGGKTTWVMRNAQPGDVVVDHDHIARRLGSPSLWRHPRAIADQAEQIVHAMMLDIARAHTVRAWVIRTAPERWKREQLAQLLRADNVEIVDPGFMTCINRSRRDGRPAGTETAIRKWYERSGIQS